MTELSERQRVERGERAKRALEEFIAPEFAYARRVYLDRIVEVSATELNPTLRSDKITALSQGVRVLDEVEHSIACVMRDGEHTRAHMIRAEALEDLTDAQRRLLAIAPRI